MKRFVGALHRYQSIKSAQWADIYVRVLASQGSSKLNSKCIIYYFQWFFSTDKTIYNLLSLWTVLTLLKTLIAEIQKSWRSYKKSCVIRFAIDIWSTFLITMLFFLVTMFFFLQQWFFFLFKKVVAQYFSYLSEKHRRRNLFLNKDRLKLHPATIFIKKDTPVKVFFLRMSRNIKHLFYSLHEWMISLYIIQTRSFTDSLWNKLF